MRWISGLLAQMCTYAYLLSAHLLLGKLHRAFLCQYSLFFFDLQHDGKDQKNRTSHQDPSGAPRELGGDETRLVDLVRRFGNLCSPCRRNYIGKGINALQQRLTGWQHEWEMSNQTLLRPLD